MDVKRAPAAARPAATVVLLRDRPGGGVEALLLHRHTGNKFAPGEHVFPGGRVEADEHLGLAAARTRGPSPAEAARLLGVETDGGAAFGYWIAAAREAFEEAGILLACDAAGRPARLAPDVTAAWRARVNADHRAFGTLLAEEGLTLTTDALRYFAHWITPEERPIRYDTRFFVAPAPEGQRAVPDGHETVAARWLSPDDADAARARGELSLRVPTQKNLAVFAGARSVAEALARLDGRVVETVRPRLLAGQTQPTLPGEPGWR